MVEEEKFFAWLDGELAPEEAAEVERQVAADSELSHRAAAHRAMAAGLRRAFDSVASASVPEDLTRAVQWRRSNVIDFAGRRDGLARPFASPSRQWAALAASLVLGILVGTAIVSGTAGSPVEVRGDAIYAAGAVDRALDRQLASAGMDRDVRIRLTFRNASGAICRSFETPASSGLACRDDRDWRLRGLFAAPEGGTSEFRMAAGADPRLMELVESTMAGEPLDATQEAEAKRRGWR
jgi:hypothetical protein